MKNYLTPVKVFFGFEPDVSFQTTTGEIQEQKARSSVPVIPFKGKQQAPGETEIWIFEPRAYEDSQDIAACLIRKHPVIINLKYLDKSVSQRLIDFVCGTMFAVDGSMEHLGENVFLFSPAVVQLRKNGE